MLIWYTNGRASSACISKESKRSKRKETRWKFFIFNTINRIKVIDFGFTRAFSSKMCIFVIQFISMSTILLTIGSNTFAKTNIDKAKRMLTFVFPDIIFSEPILTEPEEEKYSYLFRNILAVVDTEMRPEEVIDKIKQTERAVGRTPRDKYLGKVVIDIDLVKYGDKILRPDDFEREYVQRLLATMEMPEPSVEAEEGTAEVEADLPSEGTAEVEEGTGLFSEGKEKPDEPSRTEATDTSEESDDTEVLGNE